MNVVVVDSRSCGSPQLNSERGVLEAPSSLSSLSFREDPPPKFNHPCCALERTAVTQELFVLLSSIRKH